MVINLRLFKPKVCRKLKKAFAKNDFVRVFAKKRAKIDKNIHKKNFRKSFLRENFFKKMVKMDSGDIEQKSCTKNDLAINFFVEINFIL